MGLLDFLASLGGADAATVAGAAVDKAKEQDRKPSNYSIEGSIYDPNYQAQKSTAQPSQYEGGPDSEAAFGAAQSNWDIAPGANTDNYNEAGGYKITPGIYSRAAEDAQQKYREALESGDVLKAAHISNLMPSSFGAAARGDFFGPAMEYQGKWYDVNKDQDGNYMFKNTLDYQVDPNTGMYGPYSEAGGTLSKDNFVYQGEDGNYIMPFDVSNKSVPGAIQWKNSTSPILNPTQFERDAYDYITSNEFQNIMRDQFGRDNFGADMAALQYDPELQEAWKLFHEHMHNLKDEEGNSRGYYDQDYANELFFDDNGEFNYDNYFDWINNNTNLYDAAMGNLSAEGMDWINSGGIAANDLLAYWMSTMMPQLRLSVGSGELSDDMYNQLQSAWGTDAITKDEYGNAYLENDPYGFGRDAEGNWWASVQDDRDAAVQQQLKNYFLQNIVRDSLTNEALDYQYGSYNPSAIDANNISSILKQSDLYYDTREGDNDSVFLGSNPYEYFGGSPEQWRNFMAASDYEDLANRLEGSSVDFNTGATSYARNNAIRNLKKKD